jgi:Protein of unknown function DUF262/Protein of unknown function (DUF1524)
MRADAVPLLAIFEKKMRLEVPLFQRQYVWNEERHWTPLWDDISRKFTERLEGRRDAPVHFLGAMVLDLKQTPATHVEKRQIIDGQQRLTTLQIFIAVLRDFCTAEGVHELAEECKGFTLNKGMMADQAVDRFKVWPTQLDRAQFSDVMTSGSREELERRHPLVRRKFSRKPDPRPRMVEAYLFFSDRIEEYFSGSNAEPPLLADHPLGGRLEECFQALRSSLQIVEIDLEHDDDAQVIFETLNARGEPLLPADLLRNYIFLRASRHGEPQEELYEQFWRGFDDPFWREEVRQGRLSRPRSDLLMQHFLSSRETVDIPIRHLFVEYKFWIEKAKPFATVRQELETLARQRDDFRRITAPPKEDALFPLARFLEVFEVSTAYPFLLAALDKRVSDDALLGMSTVLESYLLRRSVCGLTTKNYNRVFLQLTRAMQSSEPTAEFVAGHLSSLTGDSALWPDDSTFREAFLTKHAYRVLNQPKIVHILRRLNDSYFDSRSERVTIDGPLTIEHLLPQAWQEDWPLESGERGMSSDELWHTLAGDPRAEATRRRNELLQTFGNLTVLTQGLNGSVSNRVWDVKKPALLKLSLLSINQHLHDFPVWNEEMIESRGRDLVERAMAIWPGPEVRTT